MNFLNIIFDAFQERWPKLNFKLTSQSIHLIYYHDFNRDLDALNIGNHFIIHGSNIKKYDIAEVTYIDERISVIHYDTHDPDYFNKISHYDIHDPDSIAKIEQLIDNHLKETVSNIIKQFHETLSDTLDRHVKYDVVDNIIYLNL